MGEIDAVGEMMTGALAGRAVQPPAAHGAGHGACLNCGTGLLGAHCHHCGQPGHVHRTIGAIVHEILHGVAHAEGRLWATLPMLAFRPGELTRRYVAGERARFVSPMAAFLFSIFTMFAVFSIVGIAPPADLGDASGRVAAGMEEVRTGLIKDRKEEQEDAAQPDATPADRASAQQRIAEIDRELATIASARPVFGKTSGSENRKTGWKRLDYGLEKAAKNPGLTLYKLQANSYKFSWLLIPLSIPFVWLLFCWKREYKAYDHAVFVTYSIAFMSLLFIAVTIAGSLGVSEGWLVAAALLVPPIHIYRQLRGAYRLRRASAILRTIVLLAFVQIIVTLFLALVLGLGLIG